MPKNDKKADEPPVAPAEGDSPAELAKRHLEEALKRKREAQASQTGHATVNKGDIPHHPGGPAKGRNFRHQGR